MRVVRRWRLVGRVGELGGWLWCDMFEMCCVWGWCEVGRESERWWWSWRSSCDAVKAQRRSGGSVVAWKGLGSVHEVLGQLVAEQGSSCCAHRRHIGLHAA